MSAQELYEIMSATDYQTMSLKELNKEYYKAKRKEDFATANDIFNIMFSKNNNVWFEGDKL